MYLQKKLNNQDADTKIPQFNANWFFLFVSIFAVELSVIFKVSFVSVETLDKTSN